MPKQSMPKMIRKKFETTKNIYKLESIKKPMEIEELRQRRDNHLDPPKAHR